MKYTQILEEKVLKILLLFLNNWKLIIVNYKNYIY